MMKMRSQRFWILLALLGLALASAAVGRHAAAQPNCTVAPCKIFLAQAQVAPVEPLLNEPADNAQIASLAPILTWAPTISSTYQVRVSVDPSFATTEVNDEELWPNPLPALAFHITGSNLDPATTYYWRIGVRYRGIYRYAPVRTFRTPPMQPVLPPPPALVAPPNGTTLPTTDVTLSWGSVPGALFYRVQVRSPGPTAFDSEIVPASTLSYRVQRPLVPGTTYTWRVRTLDQYGWGDYGATRSFTAP
jgi:hypothetical protein